MAHQFYIQREPNDLKDYIWSTLETGIYIHPGAQISLKFCITHGTGVVKG